MIRKDISSTLPGELNSLLQGPVDVIIHLAAKAGVRPSIENPLQYQQANVTGLQNLLDFARLKKVKQFVFASSSSVYGVNNNYPWKETEMLLPISPYAMTKLSGEALGHVYSHLYNIRFIALRLFTVYGPSQRPDLAIHKFTSSIMQDQPIHMYGDGLSSRDYTYVEDIVNGIIAASRYDQSLFEIFNLGNNYSISLREMIHTIEAVTDKQAKIVRFSDQAGDVMKTAADISKAERLLGYSPKTDFRHGVEQFFQWFSQNKELVMDKQPA
ncbi:MAG: GDP-mannose 4,6-dehydratase [Chitinophagaceae bacterium]